MSGTPPPAPLGNNTEADYQANNADNTIILPPPTENAAPAGGQQTVNELLQTLLTKLEQQEASTRETNERLDALASAQSACQDQINNLLRNRTPRQFPMETTNQLR